MFMKKKGQASMAVGAIISLVIGIAVATLVLLFSGVLGGKAYNLVEADIDNISDATIKQNIKDGITAGFEAQKQTGEFMPLIVIGVVISIVLVLVLTLPGAGGTMRGGAL